MAVHFRYEGQDGPTQKLVDANNLLVVRTRRRQSLAQTPLDMDARRAVAPLHPVARFDDAGVEVLKAWRGKRERDDARAALKAQDEIDFAGRVLRPSGQSTPVIYTENLFVKFGDDVGPRVISRTLRALGLRSKRELGLAANTHFVESIEGTLGRRVFEVAEQLLQHPAVELCHPEVVRPMGQRAAFEAQWHLRPTEFGAGRVDANVDAAWAVTRGANVTIAVIDDGFDVDHEEFRGADKVVAPRDATRRRDGAAPQFASERHGTPCAGIACGNGSFSASGVAPDARLMPIRMRSGIGSVNEAEAIRWAVDHGADVISCSWGPGDGDWTNPDDPDHQNRIHLPDHTRLALAYAVTHGRRGLGCVITWAAGNGNEPVDNDGYASADEVMAIAACDDRGEKAPYSDHGKAIWCAFPSDRKLPSFTPGIWTTDRRGGAGYNPGRNMLGDAEGHYTNEFGGTSAACPGAAGVAALVLSQNPNLSWRKVRQVLADSADKIGPAEGYDERGHSTEFGYGRLNAMRAVELAIARQPAQTLSRSSSDAAAVRDGQTARIAIDIHEHATIEEIEVDVDIEHTHRGDLVVELVAPGGARVMLHNRRGWVRDDLKRRYDRDMIPALRTLEGAFTDGQWTLEVADRGRGDEGRLRCFGLTFVTR